MRLDELEFVRLDNATPPKIRAFLRPNCFRWRQNPRKIAIRSDAILSHEPRHVLSAVSQILTLENRGASARPLKLKEPQSHEFRHSDKFAPYSSEQGAPKQGRRTQGIAQRRSGTPFPCGRLWHAQSSDCPGAQLRQGVDCREHKQGLRLRPLPPSPEMIGLYLTYLTAPTGATLALSVSTIERRLYGLAWHYARRGFELDRKDRRCWQA